MPAPKNHLKAALAAGTPQIGIWLALASGPAAELAGGAGFDWCLIDAEHGPNTLTTIGEQLRALQGSGTNAVVRVPVREDWVIKQALDIGAQTLLVPMVHTGQDAADTVAACRYAPKGRRGMGASMARASGFGAIPDYIQTADAEICVMVQAESAQAIENIDAIAQTEGVDCVFIGPADLSADMGYPGQMKHPDVVAAIDHAITRIRAAGKAVGIIWFHPDDVRHYLDEGVTFMGVGGELSILAKALRETAQAYK